MNNNQYQLWLEGIELFNKSEPRPINQNIPDIESIKEDDPNYELYFKALGWDYQYNLDNQMRNKFQIGIQLYSEGHDKFSIRDRPVPEKLGWEFANRINKFKDYLFEPEVIEKTTEIDNFEKFKTMFFEGLKKYDQNSSSKKIEEEVIESNSSEYLGYLFAFLRTQLGNTIIEYLKVPNRKMNDIYPEKLVNQIWSLIKKEEFNKLSRFINK